jgi:hypothetical protein
MPALGMKLERHHRFPAIVTANICPNTLKNDAATVSVQQSLRARQFVP